jgi:hypothetical protein
VRTPGGRVGLACGIVILAAACGASPPASQRERSQPVLPDETASAAANGSTGATPDTRVAIGSVRLDETTCALDGVPDGLDAGDYALRAVNATPDRAAFDLFRIGPGGSVQGLVEHVDEERQRAEAGDPFSGPPPWADHILGSNLMPVGATEDLDVSLDDGTYGIVCLWNFVETPDPVRPFAVAGPITVGDAAAAVCRTTETACLGPLEAGVHRADQVDVPFAYEVGEGWELVHEDVGVVLIDRLSDAPPAGDSDTPTTPFEPGGFVLVAIDPRIAAQDPCGHASEPGVGTTVDDLVGWLTFHEGLEATEPTELTIGDRRAVSVDIVAAAGSTPACSEGVSLFVHELTEGFWWWLDDRTAERIVLVELGGGRVGLVLIEAVHAEFEEAVEAAMPVVESLRFDDE